MSIECLPPEILVEIFLFAQHYPPRTHSDPINIRGALALSQVSPIWRLISLSTSQLWSSIVLTYHAVRDLDVSASNLFAMTARVQTQLERSSPGSFTLRMSFPVSASKGTEGPRVVWGIIEPQLHRCRSLDLQHLPSESEAGTLQLFPLPPLPMIESISLSSARDGDMGSIIFDDRHHAQIPLKSFSSFGLRMTQTIPFHPVHHVHFRSLDYGVDGMSVYISWLQQWPGTPHLQTLSLVDIPDAPEEFDASLSLPRLYSLHAPLSALRLFAPLPSLRSLTVDTYEISYEPIVLRAPNLERLHLIRRGGFTASIEQFSSLKKLRLTVGDDVDSWLKFLLRGGGRSSSSTPNSSPTTPTPPVLPSLETLQISDTDRRSEDPLLVFGLISDLVAVRTRLVIELSATEYSNYLEIEGEEKALGRVRVLREEGW